MGSIWRYARIDPYVKQYAEMKIDINEEAAWVLSILAIVGAIASISMYGCHQHEETTREKIRAGLVEREAPISYSKIWTKP